MKRAAIYARFSSDLQDERSIGDQIAVCRTYAERNGYSVVATFHDREMSGAIIQGRDGFQSLLRAAAGGAFDAVIAESLSRIGRDQENRHAVLKRLTFAGVKLVTPSDGVVTSMVNGIRAIIDSQYLEDLKVMTRRGMSARVREGLSGGGRAYGYDVVPADTDGSGRGRRRINEAEAAIVRRIFAEYIDGRSALEIAAALNVDRVPAPRGDKWRANTIYGNGQRGSGILRNELYAGELVWNRLRMVLDPDTEKRVSRPNPESEWQRVAVPHLAIIDRPTFDAAQSNRERPAARDHHTRQRHVRMLSGLLRCGACGAGMRSNGADRSGTRILCASVSESGTCSNSRRYYLAPIERTVVAGLKERMGSRAAIELYVKAFDEERRRLAHNSSGRRAELERSLEQAEKQIARAVDLVMRDVISEAEAAKRLLDLRHDRDRTALELASISDDRPVTLAPANVEAYLGELRELERVVNDRISEGHEDLAKSFRRMVDRVTIMQAPPGSAPMVRVSGHLGDLLAQAPNRAVSQPQFVGGAGGSGRGIWSAPPISFSFERLAA